jgi:hypothetical protein
MKNLIAIALATGSAFAFYPTGALADFPGEVEHARADARAGRTSQRLRR